MVGPAPDRARIVAVCAVDEAADGAEAADIAASRRGDGASYERLVRRHQDAIAAYLRRFTADGRCLEELVYDVFVEAYFSLSGYSARAPFAHWLRRIATRVGYRFWKRRKRAARWVPLPADAQARVAPPDDALSMRDELDAVLGRLAPRDRLVVTLLYLEEHSVAETAALTGWSPTMVKVQAYRARRRLRVLLEDA